MRDRTPTAPRYVFDSTVITTAHNYQQFFLCVAATPWLNGKHCVFGQVVQGEAMRMCCTSYLHTLTGYEVVKAIEACGSRSGDTAFDIMIADCGQLNNGVPCSMFLTAKHLNTIGTAPGATASATAARGVRGYATVRAAAVPSWVQARGAFHGAAVLQQGVRCVGGMS